MDTTPAAGLLAMLAPAPAETGILRLLSAPAVPPVLDFTSRLKEKGADDAGTLFRDVLSAKVVDEKTGLVDYVASDESLDCYAEIVRVAGWKFTQFQKNSPFIDSHARDTIARLLGAVVGQNVDTGNRQLVERVQWAIDVEENALARFGFKMTAAGYLKAVSVGFRPTKLVWRGYSAEADWQAAVALLNLDTPTAAAVEVIYLEQEQMELSACILGANGNALAKEFGEVVLAHKAGAVTDEDLTALVKAEAKRISGQTPTPKNGPALATLASGADANRRGDVELLGLLKQYLNL